MLENNLIKQIRKLNNEYNLIEDNDHILVGISGGKDSLVLLYLLSLLKKYQIKKFKITACFINVGFEVNGLDKLKEYINSLGIEFIIEETDILFIISHFKKHDKISCARCSNMKKGAIVNVAKKVKANKIAYGHNQDDLIETLFMNIINSGKVCAFSPITIYDDNNIKLIRPMLYCEEKDILKLSKQLQLPIIKNTCPNDKTSYRAIVKDDLYNLYKKHPQARKNLLNIAKAHF